MRNRSWGAGLLVGGAVCVSVWAAWPEATSADTSASTSTPNAVTSRARVLGWGAGPEQVGMNPGGVERAAFGVTSLAVGPQGHVWVLDPVNGRVLRMADEGQPQVVAHVPLDAEDLSVGPDGILAVYSQMQAKVWLFDGGVDPSSEMKVPRAVRGIDGIVAGPAHQVILQAAHQETYQLGSPSFPYSLPAVLHSKREGAAMLPSGAGVAVRLTNDKRPQILILHPGDERTRVEVNQTLAEKVLSARIEGVASSTVCLTLEHRLDAPDFQVGRSVVCTDVSSGQLIFKQPLPGRGQFVPHRSLAVGGNPPRLAFMQPEADGLHVQVWDLPKAERGAQ